VFCLVVSWICAYLWFVLVKYLFYCLFFFLCSCRVAINLDDIEKHQKMWKIQKIKKMKNPKHCDSLDVRDGLGNFKKTNGVNVEPKATNVDESLVERAQPDLPHSLRDHFYPP